MKLTAIEKVMIGMLLVGVLGLVTIIPSCMREVKSLEQKGLKSVVNEIWEGKGTEKQESR